MEWPLPIRILLWPLAAIYGVFARIRVKLYEKGVLATRRLNSPVVSVGNLTVGGTGKTPIVLHLAEYFVKQGKQVGILTRGYGGDGKTSDEVELMKRRVGDSVVFGVGADRFAVGSMLESECAIDLFLLDDGFQHLKLHRDVDVVLWDGTKKFDEQWMLPSGSLREPVSAIGRADILVITRKSGSGGTQLGSENAIAVCAQTKLLGIRRLGADNRIVPLPEPGEQRFYSFCGIGNPAAFYGDLKRWGLETVGEASFRDHHRYSEQDAELLMAGARGAQATALLTTEKDEENLRGVSFGDWEVYVVVIEMELSPAGKLEGEIKRLLRERHAS